MQVLSGPLQKSTFQDNLTLTHIALDIKKIKNHLKLWNPVDSRKAHWRLLLPKHTESKQKSYVGRPILACQESHIFFSLFYQEGQYCPGLLYGLCRPVIRGKLRTLEYSKYSYVISCQFLPLKQKKTQPLNINSPFCSPSEKANIDLTISYFMESCQCQTMTLVSSQNKSDKQQKSPHLYQYQILQSIKYKYTNTKYKFSTKFLLI